MVSNNNYINSRHNLNHFFSHSDYGKQSTTQSTNVQQHQQQSSSTAAASTSTGQKWSCTYCTFENELQKSSCEMCNLPKGNDL